MDELAKVRRVIAVDLRGRGKSENLGAGPAWTLDDHADDVAATIDGLGGGSADVAGLSMGGYVLFALLRRHPEKVRSAMLISTKSGADDDAAKKAREATAEKARAEGTAALFAGLAPRVLSPVASDDAKARLWAMFERIPGETTARDALAMRDRPDATPDLPYIRVPATVIHGADDNLMPIAAARAMAAAIPDARFVAIAGAAHVPALEKPAETAAAMIAALD